MIDTILFANWTKVALIYDQYNPDIANLQVSFPLMYIEEMFYLFKFQDNFLLNDIDFVSKQVSIDNLGSVFADIKKHNVFNLIVQVKQHLLPLLFQESR